MLETFLESEQIMSMWDVNSFFEGQIRAIRDALKREKVLIAVSGGVDSTVSAALTYRAIGDNLVCVFIDDNFMRLNEPRQVKALLTIESLNLPIKVRDEKKRFMRALEGVGDAEEKRKIFRDTFYKVLSQAAEEEECEYLVQGTIKADVDETSGGVKTQHNILEQIGIDPVERYGFKVVEPVKSLYKYQVRELARLIGVPPQVSERQPFPGPGLSIRVVGEVTQDKLQELKKATVIAEEGFEPYGPDQYFAAIFSGGPVNDSEELNLDLDQIPELEGIKVDAGILPERATGVIDGERAYGSVIALALRDLDGDPFFPDYQDLEKIRVNVNHIYPEATRALIHVMGREEGSYSVAMRAVRTRDYLTARVAEIPCTALNETASNILRRCQSVSEVYYDFTPKPPATIEYE